VYKEQYKVACGYCTQQEHNLSFGFSGLDDYYSTMLLLLSSTRLHLSTSSVMLLPLYFVITFRYNIKIAYHNNYDLFLLLICTFLYMLQLYFCFAYDMLFAFVIERQVRGIATCPVCRHSADPDITAAETTSNCSETSAWRRLLRF